VPTSQGDEVVQNQQFEKNKAAFFNVQGGTTQKSQVQGQSEEDALKVFYGVE
jgi:hypothetical protein